MRRRHFGGSWVGICGVGNTGGHGVLEQTANDFAPLRDVAGETSWFLYGSDGCKQQNGKTDHEKRHKVFRTF